MVFEEVEARLGDDRLRVHGTVGRPPELRGTDLTIAASGDDLAHRLAGHLRQYLAGSS